jgi:serine/threonine protein kinase
MRRYYLPGDVALSLEVQDLLARIFRPDPKTRISLAGVRRHPWLQGASSVLGRPQAFPSQAVPAQSEDGIRDVIQRARQRRLLREAHSARHSISTFGEDPDELHA